MNIDSSITSRVNSLKSLPVFKSLSQSNQKDSEFSLLEIIITILVTSLSGRSISSKLESSHNGWFSFKHAVDFKGVSDTFLGFSERSISITVIIEAFPEFSSSLDLGGISFGSGQFCSDGIPVDSSSTFLDNDGASIIWGLWCWHPWGSLHSGGHHLGGLHVSSSGGSWSCSLNSYILLHGLIELVFLDVVLFFDFSLHVLISF